MRWVVTSAVAFTVFSLSLSVAQAQLQYSIQELDDGDQLVLVAGTFEANDDLSEFDAIVRHTKPQIITFHSQGGNLVKAMELGAMIRERGLATVQLRDLHCMSACFFAFIGGAIRMAEPGSLGIHASSFSHDFGLPDDEVLETSQKAMVALRDYLQSMGVDDEVLWLSLATDAYDMRFLTLREMEDFGVVTLAAPPELERERRFEEAPETVRRDHRTSKPVGGTEHVAPSKEIPMPRSGYVRHPDGYAYLQPGSGLSGLGHDSQRRTSVRLANGSRVTIQMSGDRWYKVRTQNFSGYLHQSWVKVDQFASSLPDDRRYLQVASFKDWENAVAYVLASGVPLAIHLAVNGWYAVTHSQALQPGRGADFARSLKANRMIPQDAFLTYGNTYVRRVR